MRHRFQSKRRYAQAGFGYPDCEISWMVLRCRLSRVSPPLCKIIETVVPLTFLRLSCQTNGEYRMPPFSAIKRSNTILYCRRWEATVAFYRDRLELPIAFQCDWMVEFRLCPAAYLSVADQSRTSISSAEGKGITLSFEIDHLAEAHRTYTACGLAPTAIRSRVMGADVFYLFDPEGSRIEFWSPRRDESILKV